MNFDLPIIVTSNDGRVILRNTLAAKRYAAISLYDDIRRFLANDSKKAISEKSCNFAIVELSGLGKTKFAYVFKRHCADIYFFVYVLLEADAQTIAQTDIYADFVCDTIAGKRSDAPSEKSYMLSLEINRIVSDHFAFDGVNADKCILSELVEGLEKHITDTYFSGASFFIEYEKRVFPGTSLDISLPVFYSVALILISVVFEMSSSKNILLRIGYADSEFSLGIRTEISTGNILFFRDMDIFDCPFFDGELKDIMSACFNLSGASNGKINVSVDMSNAKNFISFDYRVKNYEKRLAGFKADPEFEDN